MKTIRQAVTREIKRRKKSAYAFAKELSGEIHPITLMKWLYSNKRVSVAIAEKALAALDLVVVPRSEVKEKKKAPNACKS